MAISASASGTTQAPSASGYNYTVTAYWVENSTSTANNTSSITVKATFQTPRANFDVSNAGKLYIDWYDNNNGWQTAKASKAINSCSQNASYSCSATFNVSHKSDGSLSGYARARWDKLSSNGWVPADKSVSTSSKSLTTIPRKATVTSAPNFSDIDNPTINYSNKAGNSVTTLQASIYLPDAVTGLALYRDIPKTGTSYTFNLTNEERERLRSNCTTATSRTVRFYVRTILGGTTYTHYLEKTLSIVDANPTMEYTQVENNSKVITYLGSSSADTVIKNASNVTLSVTPTALKSATISSVVITHNGINYPATESNGVYSATFDITGDTTTITVKDSRGNSASEIWEPTVIDYQKVKQNSFSFKRDNPTSSDVILQLDSTYYQQTFGSAANVSTVKYKKGENGSWITLTAETDYTIDTTNNKITANYTISNAISYTSSDKFYIEVNDLLSSWADNSIVTKGIPVFEFGDDEVQVNGDLIIADTNRENPVSIFSILGLDTNTYDSTHTYAVGDLTIYAHAIYECNTAITTPEEWDSSKWDLVPIIKQ